MSDVAKRLFDDLLSIEVNTLVKPGMTGRKMPVPGHALLDIYSEYDIWLCTYGGRLNASWGTFVASPAAGTVLEQLQGSSVKSSDRERLVRGGALISSLGIMPLFDESKAITEDDFDELRERAKMALSMHRTLVDNGVEITKGADVMLRRIIRNSDQLKGILEAHGMTGPSASTPSLTRDEISGLSAATTFSGDEIVTIRKVWELGTETIVSQTVVQLDGDVVTRLNDSSFGESPILRDLHRGGVATAVAHWSALVDTFVTITTKLSGLLTGR